MKYLKTYKLFESSSLKTNLDIIEIYRDCFIELNDLGTFVGVDDNSGLLKDINNVINSVDVQNWNPSRMVDGDSGDNRDNIIWNRNIPDKLSLHIELRGSVDTNIASAEKKKEMYNYMKSELSNDEYQFSKVSGLSIRNNLIEVTIKEYGVYPGDKRYNELCKDRKLKGGDRSVQFNKDEIPNSDDDGLGNVWRGYVKYTRVINGSPMRFGYKEPSFIKKLFTRKKQGYKFPELTDNMVVLNFNIVHEITN